MEHVRPLQFLRESHMRNAAINTRVLAGIILALCTIFACDSRHTLVEAFLNNGAETKLFTYSDYRWSSGVGQNVAISGNRALVGDGYSSTYMYRWDGTAWMKEANLEGTRGAPVALDGIRAVVRGGHVYRFNGAQWQEEARLRGGRSVSVSGRVIAVGGDRAVYMYRLNGARWLEEARLTASVEEDAGGFGYAVSVSGNLAIIGASEENWRGNEYEYTGVAYVYRFTGAQWREESILRAADAASSSGFGSVVAINGNVAIVGAPYSSNTGSENSGSAYVFRYRNGIWHEETRWAAQDTGQAYFGSSVALDNNVAIIGAPFDDVRYGYGYYSSADTPPGAAYVYRYEGGIWRERQRLAASDGTANNRFGAAVAISGRSAIVGAPAPYDYQRNEGGGAAYVYTLD